MMCTMLQSISGTTSSLRGKIGILGHCLRISFLVLQEHCSSSSFLLWDEEMMSLLTSTSLTFTFVGFWKDSFLRHHCWLNDGIQKALINGPMSTLKEVSNGLQKGSVCNSVHFIILQRYEIRQYQYISKVRWIKISNTKFQSAAKVCWNSVSTNDVIGSESQYHKYRMGHVKLYIRLNTNGKGDLINC